MSTTPTNPNIQPTLQIDEIQHRYTEAYLFRQKLKQLKKSFEKQINIIKMLSITECSNAVAELKFSTKEDSIVHSILTEIEISMRQLNETVNTTINSVIKECIQPMKNFIDYDFNDIKTLKKQYDESQSSKKEQRHRDKSKKGEEIKELLNGKVDEFTMKQETKIVEYLGKFWNAIQTIFQIDFSKINELFETVTMKNQMQKKLINGSKEGHLFIKKKFGWEKNYFVLKDGKLIHYRSNDNFLIYNLVICSVRNSKIGQEMKEEKPNRFELVVANPKKMKIIVLKAKSVEEKEEWMEKIQNETQLALSRNDVIQKSPCVEKRYKITCVNSNKTEISRVTDLLLSIPGNDRCCDCFSPSPDWAIINLGILVCQKCSGVHRGFGVQISKVRSIILDDKIWTPELIQLFINLGNKKVNDIFMATATQEDYAQFRTIDTQAQREILLKLKYLTGKYAIFKNGRSIESMNRKDKLASPSVKDATPRMGHRKALSVANSSEMRSEDKRSSKRLMLSKNLLLMKEIFEKELKLERVIQYIYEGDISNVLLIILNEFPIDQQDANGWTMLHYASWFNKSHICSMLLRYQADDEIVDNNGMTAMQVAEYNHADEALDALTGIDPIPFSINDVNSKISEDNTFDGLLSSEYPVSVFPNQSHQSTLNHINQMTPKKETPEITEEYITYAHGANKEIKIQVNHSQPRPIPQGNGHLNNHSSSLDAYYQSKPMTFHGMKKNETKEKNEKDRKQKKPFSRSSPLMGKHFKTETLNPQFDDE